MRALRVIPIDRQSNIFKYSLEPGAEIIGVHTLPGLIVILDPEEPSTEMHKFLCFEYKPSADSFYGLPNTDVYYVGHEGNFYVFEVLE